MQHRKSDTLVFLGLVFLCLLILILTAGQSTIDIQLHDTYFILDKVSLTILIIGPLTFLIFLARGITRKFRTISTNMGLIIGLALVALITYQVASLQTEYVTEVMKLDRGELPDRGQVLAEAQDRITWTRGLLILWLVALLILILKTVKLLKNRTHQQ